MKMFQKRIAVFLCLLMTFAAVGAFLPSQKTEVRADTIYYVYGDYGFTEFSDPMGELVVEKGCDNLYLGDFISYTKVVDDSYQLGYLSEISSGVKYASDNPDVLSVDKTTGKATAKSTGSTVVTAAFQNYTLYANVKVVSNIKSSLKKELKVNNPEGYTDEYNSYINGLEDAKKAAENLIQNASGKTTEKNILSQLKYYLDLDSTYNYGVAYVWNTTDYVYSYYLYSTDVFHARRVADKLGNQLNQYNPLGTEGKYVFKISSKKGSKKTITVTLKKAVSAAQLAGAQYADRSITNEYSEKSVAFLVSIFENGTNNYTRGIATIEKGSKKIEIKLLSGSLKKGTKYSVYGYYQPGFTFSFKAQ